MINLKLFITRKGCIPDVNRPFNRPLIKILKLFISSEIELLKIKCELISSNFSLF